MTNITKKAKEFILRQPLYPSLLIVCASVLLVIVLAYFAGYFSPTIAGLKPDDTIIVTNFADDSSPGGLVGAFNIVEDPRAEFNPKGLSLSGSGLIKVVTPQEESVTGAMGEKWEVQVHEIRETYGLLMHSYWIIGTWKNKIN